MKIHIPKLFPEFHVDGFKAADIEPRVLWIVEGIDGEGTICDTAEDATKLLRSETDDYRKMMVRLGDPGGYRR